LGSDLGVVVVSNVVLVSMDVFFDVIGVRHWWFAVV
jgi:hypothetical protein